MDNSAPTLYDALVKANIKITYRHSDMFFPKTDESVSILDKFPAQKEQAKGGFRSKSTKEIMIEIPFGYMPYWRERGFTQSSF